MSRHKRAHGSAVTMSDAEIDTAFSDLDEDTGGEKGTEFLIQATADRCGVSYSRVVDALDNCARQKEPGRIKP